MCMYTAVRWTVVVSLSCCWGLEMSHFWQMSLQTGKILNPGVLKGVNLMNVTVYGCRTLYDTMYWGLEMSQNSWKLSCNVFYCAVPLPNGLEWVTNFKGSLPWRFEGVSCGNLKEVSHGDFTLSFEGSLPWRLKTLGNPMWESWKESVRWFDV